MKNLFAKDEFKLLGAFYLERFIAHLIYFAPAFFVIFFNQTLSLTQISILFSVLAISTFVLEVPTGAFADLFGRKASTLFAYIAIGILLPFFIFVHNFYLLLLLFALWGLFGTFYSGARDAWTVDNLKYYKREDLVNTYYLKSHSLVRFAMFLSGFLGAFIVAKLGMTSIWIFASLSWFISFFLLLFVKEHKLSKEKQTSFKNLYKQSRDAVNYSLKHKILLFLLLATFFVIFRDSFGGELTWLPLLRDFGFPIYAFGFLFSASMLLGSIAPFLAKPLLKICKNEKNYFILLSFIIMLLNFSVLFVNNFIIGIVIMLSVLFLIDLFIPVDGSFTQKFIPSKTRATVLSFKSMIISLAYAISYPFAGFVADHLGKQNTIVLGSLFLIPAIYCYFKIDLKEKHRKLYDNFEEKNLSDIWDKRKFKPGAVKIQSNIVRKGKNALKVTLQKGDNAEKTSERNELLERKDLWSKEEKTYKYSFSIYIPKDFLIVKTRLVLAQWKQAEEGNKVLVDNPILALRYVNKELYITLQTDEKRKHIFSTKKEVRGKWLDFTFNIKFTRKKSGFVKIWMNKKKIVDYKGITAYRKKYNYPKKGEFYFKMGLYRDQMNKPMTVYFDEYSKIRLN